MKEYSEYKESQIPWIGKIPTHWNIEPFGRHFSYGKGLPITKANLTNEGIAVISYGQIHSKLNTGTKISKELIRYVSPTYIESNPQSILKINDFIFADTSEDLNGSGNCAFNDFNNYIFAGYHTLIARPIRLDNPKYYAYLFQSQNWKNQIRSLVNGVKVYSINRAILKKTTLLFPPLSEQQHIVSFLDEKTAKIDEYIDKKNKEIEALKEWKKALIAHVVTKGLNTNAKMKDSGVSWIGEIPEHWKVKRLGSAFVENRTINSSLEITEAYKFNYGALIRKDEDVNPIEMMDTYCKYTCLNVNDIVINGLNLNYDFVSQRVAKAYAKGIITSAYLTLTPRDGINPNYYLYLLKSMDSMKLFHGMGTGIRLTLSYNEIKKQQILFPPLVEQQEIVEYIDAATTKADKMIVELTNHVESMKEYKQRLIADVVTGKINVQP